MISNHAKVYSPHIKSTQHNVFGKTISHRLFGGMLLSWSRVQKASLYTKLAVADMLLFVLWALLVIATPSVHTYVQIAALTQLLWFVLPCLVLLSVVFFVLDTVAKSIVGSTWFGIQLFIILIYTCYIALLSIYFGQYHFVSGVAVGAISVWSLFLLDRHIAYICFILNTVLLFCTQVFVAHYTQLSYAALFTDISAINTKFWMTSAFFLCVGKVVIIMLLGDAVFSLFKNRFITLSRMSQKDALTGLANRRFMHDVLYDYIKNETQLSLLLLDIDYFKNINDKYGHLTGDDVISHVAHTLSRHLPGDAQAGRFGGEEFLVILPETDIYSAKQVAENLLHHIRQLTTVTSEGIEIQVTTSIGLASSLVYNESVEKLQQDNKSQKKRVEKQLQNLLHQADVALLKAKDLGRDQLVVADILS